MLIVLLFHLTKLLRRDQLTLESPRLRLFLLQELSLALLLLLFLRIIGLYQGLASLRLGLLPCEFVGEEAPNKWSGRLGLVRNHVVAADLRSVLNAFEGVLRVASPVVEEKLLDAGCLVLVLDVRFAGEEADGAELIAGHEGLSVS